MSGEYVSWGYMSVGYVIKTYMMVEFSLCNNLSMMIVSFVEQDVSHRMMSIKTGTSNPSVDLRLTA